MDPASQERLASLVAVDPANWTDADRGFVRARSSYLTADQREALKDVLETSAPADETESAEPEKPAKKGK
jgi:hypothetical protein